ncbi:MAG: fructosamine kinase family protein [Actinomycetota bacterium]|nr:fructosamine kinase family protein [Actinomycetota bacterium]
MALPAHLSAFADVLAASLHAEFVSLQPLAGGDNAAVFRAELDDGRRVAVKTDRPGAPTMDHETEARGLSWLRESDTVRVPEVLAVAAPGPDRPGVLVLEWIEESPGHVRTPAGEDAFGRELAALHRSGAPCFGREDRRTTGSRHLPNEPCSTWAEFQRTQRLVPLARLALDAGALDAATVTALESIAERLEELGGPPEPPARLHGDLWAGNRLVDRSDHSWLIDPAAHGGHREFDLAMMRLFGGFDERCFVAYDEANPLADGWPSRVALHQLAPLVVHAVKFGGSYVDATKQAVAAYR